MEKSHRPPRNRLSQKIGGRLSRFRWSSFGRRSQGAEKAVTEELLNSVETTEKPQSGMVIGEPILYLSSSLMDGELISSIAAAKSEAPPLPPTSSKDLSLSNNAGNLYSSSKESASSKHSVVNVSPRDTIPSDSGASRGMLDSLLSIDTDPLARSRSSGCATLENLPSMFEEFRTRAYEATPYRVPETKGRVAQAEQSLKAVDGETRQTDKSHENSELETSCVDSPRTDGSAARSLSSTRSTALTCESEEFYFEDCDLPRAKPTAMPWQTSHVALCISAPTSTESIDITESDCLSEALLTGLDKPAAQVPGDTPEACAVSPPPRPPCPALIPGGSTVGSSSEDFIALFGVAVTINEDHARIADTFTDETNPANGLDTSRIYRESMKRLDEVRRLEMQMLADRIRNLETRELRCSGTGGSGCRTSGPQLELTGRIQGLPHVLPVNLGATVQKQT